MKLKEPLKKMRTEVLQSISLKGEKLKAMVLLNWGGLFTS